MKRTNTFAIRFKNENKALERAEGCTALWNVLDYKRRQSFFKGEMDWDYSKEYKSFAPNIGSSTAQQIIRKNDSAWKVFFRLLKLKKEGKLPAHIKKVSPPGYWKDRKTGKPILRMLIRFDEYRIKGRTIKFSKKMKGRIYGNLKWEGKQGLLVIRYDEQRHKWYAYMPVETQAISQPIGQNHAYVDLGVRYPITAIVASQSQPIAYSGSGMLSDWWYWNGQIAEAQRKLKLCNGKYTSSKLKRIYRTRQLRFRDAVNNLVKDFVRRCHDNGVNEIIAGDLTGIRDNGSKGKKTNTMINNFWSHKYLVDRLTCTAGNYGISVRLVDERGTSSICPRCGSDNKVRRGRLFKCKGCGLEAHRDCVGAFNIGLVHGKLSREGDSNGMMAHPGVVNDFCSFHANNLRTPVL